MRELLLIFVLASYPYALRAQDCYGVGDHDRDAIVALQDFAILASCLDGPNYYNDCTILQPIMRVDYDNDGDIDLRDAAQFFIVFGQEYFDYAPMRENEEAEVLASFLTNKLRAPDYEYNRISHDLEAIRGEYPELSSVTNRPAYQPNRLAVSLVEGASRESYNALNRHFQVSDVRELNAAEYLTFCSNINPFVLGPIYENLPEVEDAGPAGIICLPGGGCRSYVLVKVINGTFIYTFIPAYEPPCERFWILATGNDGMTISVLCYDSCMEWCPPNVELPGSLGK